MHAVKNNFEDEVKRPMKSIILHRPLALAIIVDLKTCQNVVLELASQYIEQSSRNEKDGSHIPLLYWAIGNRHVEVVLLVLKIIGDSERIVNLEYKGEDLLYYAIMYKQEAIARLLLEKGAKVARIWSTWHTYYSEWSCYKNLLMAVEIGHIGVLRLLVEKELDIAAKELYEKSYYVDDPDGFRKLIQEIRCKAALRALQMAAFNALADAVRPLVAKFVDITWKGGNGFTVLHYVAANGWVRQHGA